MATTNPLAALDVSRRNFLRLCAAASGASLVSLDARAALAAEPRRGGTLRVPPFFGVDAGWASAAGTHRELPGTSGASPPEARTQACRKPRRDTTRTSTGSVDAMVGSPPRSKGW